MFIGSAWRSQEPPLVARGGGELASRRGYPPYVQYQEVERFYPSFVPTESASFGYSYRIFTDERKSRLCLTGGTDANSVGIQLPPDREARYGLVSIPVRNEVGTLTTFTHPGDHDLPSVTRYLEPPE